MTHPNKMKGTPEYEAWRQKLRESHKGHIPWNKGIPLSENHKAKVVEARKRQIFTPETRAKLSESRKGRVFTPETRKKISDAQKGKPRWTPEDRARMSEQRIGHTLSDEQKAKRKKFTLSEQTKARMSVTRKGRTKTAEHRAKISAGEKGKLVLAETREKLRINWSLLSEEEKTKRIITMQDAAMHTLQSKLEDIIASRLDEQGIVYERQKRIGWYKVDFYIPDENRIIEVNGCYWHCCQQCGRERGNGEKKREEDTRRYEYLHRKGYAVDIVWEHDLSSKSRQK